MSEIRIDVLCSAFYGLSFYVSRSRRFLIFALPNLLGSRVRALDVLLTPLLRRTQPVYVVAAFFPRFAFANSDTILTVTCPSDDCTLPSIYGLRSSVSLRAVPCRLMSGIVAVQEPSSAIRGCFMCRPQRVVPA